MDIYRDKNDFSTSVIKAFEEIDPNYEDYPGLVITGSHAPDLIANKLDDIQAARIDKTPFLGICLGMQLMMIEFARNVLNMKGANSVEVDPKPKYPIIVAMKKLRVGLKGGESYWHNYQFNKKYTPDFEAMNMKIAFKDGVADMARIMEHPYFVGVAFHPEYQSSKDKPHDIFKTFLNICKQESLKA